jgi:TPR repeat protein
MFELLRIKMNKKSNLLFLLGMSLLLIAQSAHADFRKALDAYIARDGETMLKEVKDATDKKNDDGLMLLLMATNMDAGTSDYDDVTKQSKSTLRAILPKPHWDEIRELLVRAANDSTVDAQYSLIKSAFGKDIVVRWLQEAQIKRGEKPKTNYSLQEINEGYEVLKKELRAKGLTTSEADMMTRAEAGDAAAQLTLGLMYSHYTGYYDYACDSYPNHPACKVLNEAKGLEWLKKSALSYERQGLPIHETSGYFAVMCDFYQRKPNASPSDLKQAYLWCEGAFSLGSPDVLGVLNKMRQSGNLKLSDSQVAAILTLKNKITEWPELMVEARKAVAHEDLPVFSYEFKDEVAYRLDLYSDGRVVLNPRQFAKSNALIMKVDSKRINEFIKALNQMGFNEWPLFSGGIMCDMGCGTTFSSAMLRINNAPRRVTFYSDKMEPTYANKKPMMIRQAKLKVLVDTYFPTKQLRIELGSSEKLKSKFLAREAEWIELAKKGE